MKFQFKVSGPLSARTDRHRLAGTIIVDGLPAKRLVVVFDRTAMVLVGSVLSDSDTGAWEISCIPEFQERQLLVVALDSNGSYNAEVADYISQVATV